jgi:F-type H+-transporting ATPase subunit delta
MSDTTTIARPYAKAIFNHALASKLLAAWSIMLQDLSQAVLDPTTNDFISNPAVTPALQIQLLVDVCTKKDRGIDKKSIESLITLLADNKRLLVLPDIYVQYEALRATQEKTLTAQVSSFTKLTSAQQKQLIDSLSQRLQREVALEITIDKSLLGGAVIHAGDLVIDGSVRGKLSKLGTHLAA